MVVLIEQKRRRSLSDDSSITRESFFVEFTPRTSIHSCKPCQGLSIIDSLGSGIIYMVVCIKQGCRRPNDDMFWDHNKKAIRRINFDMYDDLDSWSIYEKDNRNQWLEDYSSEVSDDGLSEENNNVR